MKKYAFLLLATGLCLSACHKNDDDVKPGTPATVSIHFDNRFGQEDFALQKAYLTQNGDSVAINRLFYFISNVELVKTDGSVYKVPQSYYLIQVTDQLVREEINLPNIPPGEYKKLRFLVGVDSVQNQSTAQAVGDLTISNHMTWDWNTGYMFLNVDAVYYNPTSGKFEGLFYEIGKNRNSRTVELLLPAPKPTMIVDGQKSPKIHIHADVKTIFGGSNVLDVKTEPRIDGTPQHTSSSIKVADNYAQMFKIDHIH